MTWNILILKMGWLSWRSVTVMVRLLKGEVAKISYDGTFDIIFDADGEKRKRVQRKGIKSMDKNPVNGFFPLKVGEAVNCLVNSKRQKKGAMKWVAAEVTAIQENDEFSVKTWGGKHIELLHAKHIRPKNRGSKAKRGSAISQVAINTFSLGNWNGTIEDHVQLVRCVSIGRTDAQRQMIRKVREVFEKLDDDCDGEIASKHVAWTNFDIYDIIFDVFDNCVIVFDAFRVFVQCLGYLLSKTKTHQFWIKFKFKG
jgi:hypothetical protein